jgi:Mor family transcriptional regulator
MQNIQTVSQITTDDLYDYLRIAEKDTDTTNLLSTLLSVAKVYVGEYTGRTIQDLDNYRDIIICVLVLVQDMYDNRTLYVDKGNVNKVVESILGLHSVNLL